MPPTVRQLQYFLAAAECGQISRAAKDMNVTQSSITIAIQDLESRLGYKLFHRKSQGVELTMAGRLFHHHAASALAGVEDLMTLSPASEQQAGGHVRIGITDTIAGYYLPRVWKDIKRNAPKLELQVTELARGQIEQGLLERQFDLGIVLTSNVRNIQAFEIETLLTSQRQLWLGTGHRLVSAETVSLTQLVDEPYFLLQTDDHEHTMNSNWGRHGFQPKVVFRSYSIEAVRSLVAAGLGIAILSDMIYRAWSLEGQRILRKPLVEGIETMDTGIIWPKAEPLSRPAKLFVEILIGRNETSMHRV